MLDMKLTDLAKGPCMILIGCHDFNHTVLSLVFLLMIMPLPGLIHEDTLALADAIEADVDPRPRLIRMRDNLSWAHV